MCPKFVINHSKSTGSSGPRDWASCKDWTAMCREDRHFWWSPWCLVCWLYAHALLCGKKSFLSSHMLNAYVWFYVFGRLHFLITECINLADENRPLSSAAGPSHFLMVARSLICCWFSIADCFVVFLRSGWGMMIIHLLEGSGQVNWNWIVLGATWYKNFWKHTLRCFLSQPWVNSFLE